MVQGVTWGGGGVHEAKVDQVNDPQWLQAYTHTQWYSDNGSSDNNSADNSSADNSSDDNSRQCLIGGDGVVVMVGMIMIVMIMVVISDDNGGDDNDKW